MINKNLVFLFADTVRSRAYLQNVIRYDLLPAKIILLNKIDKDYFGMKNNLSSQKIVSQLGKKYKFNPNITLINLIKKFNINYEYIGTDNINSNKAYEYIKKTKQKFFIYSGYGGVIIKEHLFKLNKKFIHVHGGILPEYKGSTTNYYSILDKNIFGATSLYLNTKIDSGKIIIRKIYKLKYKYEEMDYYFDNLIRSEVLIKTLRCIKKQKIITNKKIKSKKGNTYYIIHPVLKKIAQKKIDEN